MEELPIGRRVQVYIDEHDTRHHESMYMLILDLLKNGGAAGATVTRGVAGFGIHGEIHSARIVELVSPLPLIITWIDTPERVDRLLPSVCELVEEGLVTVEDVRIAKHSASWLES